MLQNSGHVDIFFLVGGSFHVLCLESLEGGDVDVRDQSVKLVGSILILVSHT